MQRCIRHGHVGCVQMHGYKHRLVANRASNGLSAADSRSSSNSKAHSTGSMHVRLPTLRTIPAAAAVRRRAVVAAVGTDSESAAAGDSGANQQQQQQLSGSHTQHVDQTRDSNSEDRSSHNTDRRKGGAEAEGSESDNDADSDEDNDEQEFLSSLRGMMPTQQQQAILASQISARAYDSAVEDLGARMLNAGVKGCMALGLGWLLHIDVIGNFRWNTSDLQQGVLWALPAAAMAALFTAVPLPGQQQQQHPVAAAAASSSSSRGQDDLESAATYEHVKKMARNSMLAKSLPIEVEIDLDHDSKNDLPSPATKGPMTDMNAAAAVRALSLLQEGFNKPWILDLAPPAARVIRVVDEQLKRVSNEVLWRGLVATALAAALNNTWTTAGTNQDSSFFYARLFGLVTPQASLAAAAGILLLGRLPYLLLSSRALSLYTRLSNLDVRLVGQLTEDEWLVKVVPAAAAAVGGSSSSSEGRKAGRGVVFGKLKQQQQQQREKLVDHTGGSSSRSLMDELAGGSSSSGSSKTTPPEVPVITQQQLESQFEQLLLKVALFCAGSSSSSRDAVISADEEEQGADYAALILDMVELSAAAKAAAAAGSSSSSSSSRVRKVGIDSSKVATALKALMTKLNGSRQQHYYIIRLGDLDDEDESDSDDSSGSDSDSDDDVADLVRSASPAAKAAAARAAAAVKASGSSDQSKSMQERLANTLHEVSPNDLTKMKDTDRMAVLETILKEVLKTSSYARVMAQGWRTAAAVPTAEDKITSYLLGLYAILTELAPAGAFVATGGNAAASVVASCCYNVLAILVNESASKRERERVHRGLGPDWLLRLLPLQGKDL